MTEEKAEYIRRMKIKQIHFAWDRYEDKEKIIPKFEMFRQITGWKRQKMTVYTLCGFDTTLEQDLERIYMLRDMGYSPYIMIYDKHKISRGSELKKMQRWVNSRVIFASVKNSKITSNNAVCPPIPTALVKSNLPELCIAKRQPICRLEEYRELYRKVIEKI